MNFEQTFNALVACKSAFYKKQKQLQAKLDSQVEELFKKWKTATKSKSKKKTDCPTVKELWDKTAIWVPKFTDNWYKRMDKLEMQLRILAMTCQPTKTEEPEVYDYFNSSNWHTQGFGEVSYARNYGKTLQTRVEAAGIKSEIKEEKGQHGGVDVTVFAFTDKIGVEIIKRKAFPLAVTIRGYWQRGVNPRVDYPYLNHEYEEDIGIDYFGRIVNQELFDRAAGLPSI